jgi:hypothetical protein
MKTHCAEAVALEATRSAEDLAKNAPQGGALVHAVVRAFADYQRAPSQSAFDRLFEAVEIAHGQHDAWHDLFFLVRDDGQREPIFTRVLRAKLWAGFVL